MAFHFINRCGNCQCHIKNSSKSTEKYNRDSNISHTDIQVHIIIKYIFSNLLYLVKTSRLTSPYNDIYEEKQQQHCDHSCQKCTPCLSISTILIEQRNTGNDNTDTNRNEKNRNS